VLDQGKGKPAQIRLYQLASNICERMWKSAWLKDWEFVLWREYSELSPALTNAEWNELDALIKKNQGWLMHQSGSIVFVPLAIWEEQYQAYKSAI